MNSVPTITAAEAGHDLKAIVAATTLLLVACSDGGPRAPTVQPASSPAPVVTRSDSGGEISYHVADDACHIHWNIRVTQPDVIQHRSNCRLLLQAQQPLLQALWEATAPAAGTSLQLFWGRLCPDAGCGERQLSQRLALAAFHSPAWDTGRGQPASGHANAFVRTLANAQPIYPEMKTFFAQQGYTFELSGVEKVLVSPASDLPYYDVLRQQGVPPEAKLPFDAQAWFRLTPRT